MKKILVISLAGIGDTILATPLIRELRANFPEAQIDALVLWAGSKDVLAGNRWLNQVYQKNFIKAGKAETWGFLKPLRAAGYDISINTHPQSRIHYRVIARLVGARRRISHEYECTGWLDRLLVNQTLPQDYALHTVENNLNVLPLLGKQPIEPRHELEVPLSAAEHEWAERFLAAQKLGARPRLGVHAGSGGTKNLMLKRWPLDRYIQLLQRLTAARPEAAVLLFGGPDEQAEVQQITDAVKSPSLLRVPSENLCQAAALIQRCTAFLSVDTALLHIAAAVKAPRQLVIEAPTLNKTNEPYANPWRRIQNPAIQGRHLDYYKYDGRGIQGSREELVRVMSSVTVESVFDAVLEALR